MVGAPQNKTFIGKREIKEITGCNLSLNLEIILHRNIRQYVQKTNQRLIRNMLLAAGILIATKWKAEGEKKSSHGKLYYIMAQDWINYKFV